VAALQLNQIVPSTRRYDVNEYIKPAVVVSYLISELVADAAACAIYIQ